MTQANRLDQRIRLPDGRMLGFAEWGDPDGRPVFFCHGLPGSRLPGSPEPPDASILPGIRVIGVDRPGMGLSTWQPGRRLLDWPADLVHLADALGLTHFAVMGGSAGGPYALVTAHAVPDRLRAVVVIGSPAPFDRPGAFAGYDVLRNLAYRTLRAFPPQACWVAWVQRRGFGGRRDRLPKHMVRAMARADRDALRDPALQAHTARALSEAFRQGSRGVARDMVILVQPWGFRPQDIQVPVDLWQGTTDRNVPPAAGRYLARAIPRCNARFVAGAGHLLGDPSGEIRQALLA